MTVKIKAGSRLQAAPRSSPSSMSNNDVIKRLVDSISHLMDWGLKDMGWSYEKALAHAKEKSTAGPAVWAEIEKKYKGMTSKKKASELLSPDKHKVLLDLLSLAKKYGHGEIDAHFAANVTKDKAAFSEKELLREIKDLHGDLIYGLQQQERDFERALQHSEGH